MGGVFTKIIERNTAIPVSKSQIFTTAVDNQTRVEIHVLQGERPMASDNVSLGRFFLDGIPPAPRGVPQIEVTFNIDVNGILNVTAKDLATGKAQQITIQSSRLSEEEIERMRREAEANEEADKRKRELADARNEADSAVYNAEKLLRDLGDKVTQDEKSKVQSKIEAVKQALSKDDVLAIKSACEDLTKDLNELAVRLYSQAAQEKAGVGSAGTSEAGKSQENPSEGPTVDAEYKDRGEA